MFGLGPRRDKDTGELLKVSEYIKSEENIRKLDKIQVYHVNEELSVGFIYDDEGICGFLSKESKHLGCFKEIDNKQDYQNLITTDQKNMEPASKIKEFKLELNDKIQIHHKDSYSHKEKARQKDESVNYPFG